jgi:hypothetical protein
MCTLDGSAKGNDVNDVIKSALAMMVVSLFGGLIIILTHTSMSEARPCGSAISPTQSARDAMPVSAPPDTNAIRKGAMQ